MLMRSMPRNLVRKIGDALHLRVGGDATVGQTGPRERPIKLKLDLQIDARLVVLGLYLGGLILKLHS